MNKRTNEPIPTKEYGRVGQEVDNMRIYAQMLASEEVKPFKPQKINMIVTGRRPTQK